MVTASAPGKVILFGEHAVVYGEPSLVAALDKRTYVDAATREDNKINIVSALGSDTSTVGELRGDTEDDFRYVKRAIALVFERLNESAGFDISIRSDVPPASGLGSSASVSIATIMAVSEELGVKLDRKEIAELGHKVELGVQGSASPTDTSISTFGGVLFVKPKENEVEQIEVDLSLVVGYTGVERSTKFLVDRVRRLREEYPDIVGHLIRDIGKLTREAKHMLVRGDDVGMLMNVNHGLLEALGVSTEQLSRAVYAARQAGASGAKLTGAGGGGCMIALTPKNQDAVMRAVDGCGCKSFYSVITRDGVRLEET
ncbi:MAG: mevalonate kinase [Candidatus Hydrothermarchaeaceae archaeon]